MEQAKLWLEFARLVSKQTGPVELVVPVRTDDGEVIITIGTEGKLVKISDVIQGIETIDDDDIDGIDFVLIYQDEENPKRWIISGET